MSPQLHGGQGFSSSVAPPPGFTEATFGNFLAATTADFLVSSQSYTSHQYSNQKPTAQGDKAAKIAGLDPAPRILASVEKTLAHEMRWHKQGAGAPFKVEMQTSNWGIRHHAIKVTRYTVDYAATFTIKENKADKPKGNYLWCSYHSPVEYAYDDIFANNHKILKHELDLATRECVTEISDKLKQEVAKGKASK